MSDPTPLADSIRAASSIHTPLREKDEQIAIEIAARAFKMSGAEAVLYNATDNFLTYEDTRFDHRGDKRPAGTEWSTAEARVRAARGEIVEFMDKRGYQHLAGTFAYGDNVVDTLVAAGQKVAQARTPQ